MLKRFIVLLKKEYQRHTISFGLKQDCNHYKETNDIISDRPREKLLSLKPILHTIYSPV